MSERVMVAGYDLRLDGQQLCATCRDEWVVAGDCKSCQQIDMDLESRRLAGESSRRNLRDSRDLCPGEQRNLQGFVRAPKVEPRYTMLQAACEAFAYLVAGVLILGFLIWVMRELLELALYLSAGAR